MSVCVLQAHYTHRDVGLVSCWRGVLKCGPVYASMCQVCVRRNVCPAVCETVHNCTEGECSSVLPACVFVHVSRTVASCCEAEYMLSLGSMCPAVSRVSPHVCVAYTQHYVGADVQRCVSVAVHSCM